jgi:hypothetical protein
MGCILVGKAVKTGQDGGGEGWARDYIVGVGVRRINSRGSGVPGLIVIAMDGILWGWGEAWAWDRVGWGFKCTEGRVKSSGDCAVFRFVTITKHGLKLSVSFCTTLFSTHD